MKHSIMYFVAAIGLLFSRNLAAQGAIYADCSIMKISSSKEGGLQFDEVARTSMVRELVPFEFPANFVGQAVTTSRLGPWLPEVPVTVGEQALVMRLSINPIFIRPYNRDKRWGVCQFDVRLINSGQLADGTYFSADISQSSFGAQRVLSDQRIYCGDLTVADGAFFTAVSGIGSLPNADVKLLYSCSFKLRAYSVSVPKVLPNR